MNEVTNEVAVDNEVANEFASKVADDVANDAVAEMTEANFDDVEAIIAERKIGTFVIPLGTIRLDGFRNAREEDSSPSAILGIQGTLGSVADSFDTGNQIQEVSIGFVTKDDAVVLGAFAGFTRAKAMRRITLEPVITRFNDVMGYKSPNDEGYIVPDGRGIAVDDYDKDIDRISNTSDEWRKEVEEALMMYAVRVRTSNVSSKRAYIKSNIENNQRSSQSTGAKAASCAFMRSEYKMSGREISDETNLLQAHVSQYLLISDIPAILLSIVEYEIEGGGTVEDTQRELMARCIEEWGRRTFLPVDNSCAILISHARVLGPALRGFKKNAVDLTSALNLMCELCRIEPDTGKANRKDPRPDLATFTALVNSAKEHGAMEEVPTELASDEIASLIASQGEMPAGGVDPGSSEIDDILGHIGDASSSDAEGVDPGVDIAAIVSAGESNESDVVGSESGETVSGELDVNAVNEPADDAPAEPDAPSAEGTVDFNDLGDIGGLDGEDADDFSMPDDSELKNIESVTGERNVGSIDASEIQEATVESKPRSTLIKKSERALMLVHTANEGAEESTDEVVRIFGCRPGMTLVQLATSAALSDAANEGGKDELNTTLSKFLDGLDDFLSEAVKVAAEHLNSADFSELAKHAIKIDLDSVS